MRTATTNTEYFIKKENIEILKLVISSGKISFSDVVSSKSFLSSFTKFLQSSTMECDVEVANQFLNFVNTFLALSFTAEEKFFFLSEISAAAVLKDYIENTMVESNYNLSVSIVQKLKQYLALVQTNKVSEALLSLVQNYVTPTEDHQHEDDIPNFFNFDNDDYDCHCC